MKNKISHSYSNLSHRVTRKFRDQSIEQFPVFSEDTIFSAGGRINVTGTDLFKIYAYLLFNPRIIDGDVLLCVRTIGRVIGIDERTMDSGNYPVIHHLEAFREHVFPDFKYNPEDRHKGKCRTVKTLGVPKDFEEVYLEELCRAKTEFRSLVDLVSGAPVFKGTLSVLRRQRKDALSGYRIPTGFNQPEEQRLLIEYLHSLPSNTLSSAVSTGYPDACRALCEEFHSDVEAGTVPNFSAKVQLDYIARFPQPFYGPSGMGKTVRIFPRDYSIAGIGKNSRRLLTKGWYEFDLRAAHLAIVAQDWGLGETRSFLGHENIWSALMSDIGFPLMAKYEEVKGILKTATYSLVYGSSLGNISSKLGEDLREIGYEDSKHVDLFGAHPIVREISRGITEQREKARGLGYIEDFYGTRYGLDGEASDFGKQFRSTLSTRAQSRELQLLFPAVELAVESRERAVAEKERVKAEGRKGSRPEDFRIMCWQHDGFTVAFRDNESSRDLKPLIRKIQGVVDERAKEFDIPTRLEVLRIDGNGKAVEVEGL